MAELLLDSLEISNFKLFKHLKVERLGRVNLVVGQNGAGKTALLEALWLYANQGSLKSALELLEGRRELNPKSVRDSKIEDEAGLLASLKQLFNGRQEFKPSVARIKIGSSADPQKAITLEVSKNLNLSKFNNLKEQLGLDYSKVPVEEALVFYYSVNSKANLTKGIFLEQGREIEEAGKDKTKPAGYFISDGSLTQTNIKELWDRNFSPTLEKEIVEALRVVLPEIYGVLVANQAGDDQLIAVELDGGVEPLPLKSLGNGLSKVLGIALALENSKNGILLVDEIENGLHFSTQLALWRLIFATATRLNVQVFATTHSWDCIEAFQKASREDPETGMLVRLDKNEGEITPIVLDERRLKILTREQIEVR